MIVQGSKETSAIYVGQKVVKAVYHGVKLVWQAISNIWIGKQVWRRKEIW